MKLLITRYRTAFKLFLTRSGPLLSAAAAFYLLISIIPMILLFVRVCGMFLGNLAVNKVQLLEVGKLLFPSAAPEILVAVDKALTGLLFAGGKITWLNFLLMSVSGLTFINAIRHGLFMITGDPSHRTLSKHLKGVLLLILTVLLFILAMLLPGLFNSAIHFLTSSTFVEKVVHNIPHLSAWHDWARGLEIGPYFLFKSSLFSSVIFIFYFIFLYRWFFNGKITFLESLWGASTFIICLSISRSLFWVYLKYLKQGLMQNYGNYYTLIIGLVWVYVVLALFFFGACLCHGDRDRRIFRNHLDNS